MKPVIIDENKIYAIGYSYATDWKNLLMLRLRTNRAWKCLKSRKQNTLFLRWIPSSLLQISQLMSKPSVISGDISSKNGCLAADTATMTRNAILKYTPVM